MHFYPGYTKIDMEFDAERTARSTAGLKVISDELAELSGALWARGVKREDVARKAYEFGLGFLPFSKAFLRRVEFKTGKPIDWPEFLTNFSRRGPVEPGNRPRNIIETTAVEFFYNICYTWHEEVTTEEAFRVAFEQRYRRYYRYHFWMDMPAYEQGFEQGVSYRELIEEAAVELFNRELVNVGLNAGDLEAQTSGIKVGFPEGFSHGGDVERDIACSSRLLSQGEREQLTAICDEHFHDVACLPMSDDDGYLRDYLARALDDEGFDVIAGALAKSAREAASCGYFL